jgi:hypothetical protein
VNPAVEQLLASLPGIVGVLTVARPVLEAVLAEETRYEQGAFLPLRNVGVREVLSRAQRWRCSRTTGSGTSGATVRYTLDGARLTLYFGSEQRVDFRQFLRQLGDALSVRVELRQIGARDEAKFAGGVGRCGRAICCVSWLTEFAPISVRMAKEQPGLHFLSLG